MVLNSPQGQLIIGENIPGSSNNDLLKVSSDIALGGGPLFYDGDIENMELRAQSLFWNISVLNEDTAEESNFAIINESGISVEPFLISERNYVAIGGDDDTPNDNLHIVEDKNSVTAIRVDNTNAGTSTIHTALRLYEGDQLQAVFQHNNNRNILQIGHAEATGIVELSSGGNRAMILENNATVTIENLINIRPVPTPLNPNEGDIYYNNATNKLRVFNGTIWEDLN